MPNPPTSTGALCASLEGRSTLTRERKKKEKRARQFSPPLAPPFGPSSPTPPTHPSSMHKRIRRLFRPSSSSLPPTTQGNEHTAAPTWGWLTAPGHPRGSSLPPPPVSLLPASRSCNGAGHVTLTFWRRCCRTSTRQLGNRASGSV